MKDTFDEHETTKAPSQRELYKAHPLKAYHLWYVVLMGANIPFYTFQYWCTLFLLARTDAGCDYYHWISLGALIIISSDAAVIPLCGFLCKHFARSNHVLVCICVLARICLAIGNIAAVFLSADASSSTAVWWMMVSNALFNALGVQLNYSMVAVVKIHVELEHRHDKAAQIAFLSRIGIFAKFWFHLPICAAALCLFLLIDNAVVSALSTLMVVVALMLVFGAVLLTAACFVYRMQAALHLMTWKHSNLNALLVNESNDGDADDGRCCGAHALWGKKVTRLAVVH